MSPACTTDDTEASALMASMNVGVRFSCAVSVGLRP
jgi:hypothetical protein